MSIAVVTAVGLNLIFMLGRWRYDSISLTEGAPGSTLNASLQRQASAWKLPKVEADRIASVVKDILRQIHSNRRDGSEIGLRVGFDDFDVRVRMTYEGSPPALSAHRMPRGDLIEEQTQSELKRSACAELDAADAEFSGVP